MHNTIVSNVAQLSDEVLVEIDEAAEATATKEMEIEKPLRPTYLYVEGNRMEDLLNKQEYSQKHRWKSKEIHPRNQ